MKDFRFISQNTAEHLSLHDCQCSRLWFDGSALIFDMEWMEVLSSHPDNPYDKAHQSAEGRVVLTDPVIISGTLTAYGKNSDREIHSPEQLDLRGFEILDFNAEYKGEHYSLRLFGAFDGGAEFEYIDLNLTYSASTVMFNKLTNESWFEDERFTVDN